MEAGPILGVWYEKLENGHVLWVNTLLNVVRVTNPERGHSVKYDFDEGIRISDIINIKQAHERHNF